MIQFNFERKWPNRRADFRWLIFGLLWQLTITQINISTITHYMLLCANRITFYQMMASNCNTFSRLVYSRNSAALTKEHREGGDRPLECSIFEWWSETEYKCRIAIGRYSRQFRSELPTVDQYARVTETFRTFNSKIAIRWFIFNSFTLVNRKIFFNWYCYV